MVNLTAWAIATEVLGQDAVRVYFELCAVNGMEPNPTDAVACYRGFTVEVDADGVATIQHRFEF